MAMKILLILFVVVKIQAEFEDDYDTDIKESFFRNLRSYNKPESSNSDKKLLNIPKPGDFQVDNNKKYERIKRSYHVLPSSGLTSHFKIDLPAEKLINKKNKRDVQTQYDNKEIQEKYEDETVTQVINNKENNKFESRELDINDFIRFKRSSDEKSDADSKSRLKRDPEIRTEKMVMERNFNEPGTEREPRGATKEQWIKQPYPVERSIDDNVPSASDNIRAPRVHFVTQRRPGINQNQGSVSQSQQPIPAPPPPPPPQPPTPYHGYRLYDDREREGRARDFDGYFRPQYYPYPRPRSYDPYRPRYYDPYIEHYDDRDRIFAFDGLDSRFKYEEGRPMLPPPLPQTTNKQRRIIYYATLPEFVRTPTPKVDRYGYRQDRYEDRYISGPGVMSGTGISSAATAGSGDYYRTRKSYGNQVQKPRDYDNNTDRKKTPLYPVKVSTDVNVREPKKNPERRIYSEVDRRYEYKHPSFQTPENEHF